MTEVIGVRFKEVGKVYYFDPNGTKIEKNTDVIVETQRGTEFGCCIKSNFEIEDEKVILPLRKVIRIAEEKDYKTLEANKAKLTKNFDVCRQKIEHHKLDMKIVDMDMVFDGSKIIFYFTSDGRVDFRELVKDLAAIFRTRIELRQIGVRDESKMIGGLSVCGRALCCSTFLDEFHPVSIKMAKEQGLSLNPTKISGTCGRLMCCLKYEQDAYEDLIKTTPRLDSIVSTPQGNGTITEVSLLRGNLKVMLDNGEVTPKVFHKSQVKLVKLGKLRDSDDSPKEPRNNSGDNKSAGRSSHTPKHKD